MRKNSTRCAKTWDTAGECRRWEQRKSSHLPIQRHLFSCLPLALFLSGQEEREEKVEEENEIAAAKKERDKEFEKFYSQISSMSSLSDAESAWTEL